MISKILAGVVFAVFLLSMACGDDESNPQGGGTNPTASTLTASVSDNAATLTWTQCPDDDFSAYNLYRATSSGIASNPAQAVLVATLTTADSTTFVDAGLGWNETYYYALKTVNNSQLTAWSNEATVTTPDSSGSGVLSCYQIQGQADASPYEGDDVSVTGIVTVGAGEYYAGSGTAEYAVIEDASGGEWSGLVLYGYDGVLDALSRGDSVVVSGYVQEFNGLTEVVVNSVGYDQSGYTPPSPESISTADVQLEKWEGVLVGVSDVEVTDDDLGYGEWAIDDGSGNARVDDLGDYTYSPQTGDTFTNIYGVVFFTYDNYKIEPRDNADLVN